MSLASKSSRKNFKYNGKDIYHRYEMTDLIKSHWDLANISNKHETKIFCFDAGHQLIDIKKAPKNLPRDTAGFLAKSLSNNGCVSMIIAENSLDENIFPKDEHLKKVMAFKNAGETIGAKMEDYFIISTFGHYSYAQNDFE